MKKFLTITVMSCTALSTLSTTPAFALAASGPNDDTATLIDTACANALAAKVDENATLHDGQLVWSTEVELGSASDGLRTEVARLETPGSRFGTTTAGPAGYHGLTIATTVPYRTGGSVNLFGDQVAKYKDWKSSEYDFTADYDTITTFNFGCSVSQLTEQFYPEVNTPAVPAQGPYFPKPGHVGKECDTFNEKDSTWPQWGDDQAQCYFDEDAYVPGEEAVHEDAYWETIEPAIDRTDLATSGLSQTETLHEDDVPGHEVNGGPWTQENVTGQLWMAAQVVICNSPGSKGGAWRVQNGYNPDFTTNLCNTTHFKGAPYGGGSQTSNGTYISVPGY